MTVTVREYNQDTDAATITTIETDEIDYTHTAGYAVFIADRNVWFVPCADVIRITD